MKANSKHLPLIESWNRKISPFLSLLPCTDLFFLSTVPCSTPLHCLKTSEDKDISLHTLAAEKEEKLPFIVYEPMHF